MLLKSSQKSEFWESSSGSEEETEVSIEPVQEELVQHVRSRIKPKRGIDLYAESKMIERAKIDKRLAWEARKRQQVSRVLSKYSLISSVDYTVYGHKLKYESLLWEVLWEKSLIFRRKFLCVLLAWSNFEPKSLIF